MKTYRHLWPRIVDLDALYAAYRKARQGHISTASHLRFADHLGTNLLSIQRRLLAGEWTTGPYLHFTIHEPKTREIAALPFEDRVVQHALHAAIEPIWERRFIADSYACRVGRGTHYGLDRIQSMVRSCIDLHGRAYALKADVRSYFASVHRPTLKRLVRRHVACRPTLALVDEIIDSPGPAERGIPIGNLTSQLLANVYLHELDRYAKGELKVRWYGRYMDDFVAIGPDKAQLHRLRRHLDRWLAETLRLDLNDRTQVQPVSDRHRLDILGYRIGPWRRSVRRSTIRRLHRGLAADRRGKLTADPDAFRASYRGILSHERPRRRTLPAGLELEEPA